MGIETVTDGGGLLVPFCIGCCAGSLDLITEWNITDGQVDLVWANRSAAVVGCAVAWIAVGRGLAVGCKGAGIAPLRSIDQAQTGRNRIINDVLKLGIDKFCQSFD